MGLRVAGVRVDEAPPPPDDEPPERPLDIGVTPGSRLRPVVATADGVGQFLRWHDTELGVDCEFRHTTDGEVRCIPGGASVVFADAACEVPAFRNSPCADEPHAFGRDPRAQPCDSPVAAAALYERGSENIAASSYYTTDVSSLGEVICTGPHQLGQDATLTAAVPVAPQPFVAATEKLTTGGGRLARRELLADDGATERLKPYDSKLEASCRSTAGFGDERCFPDHTAAPSPSWFTDASCQTPSAARRSYCAPVVVTRSSSCDPFRVFAVGAQATALYGSEDLTCTLDDLDPYFPHTHIGPELFAEDFAATTRVEQGAGSVRLVTVADATGVALQKGTLLDVETGQQCSLWRGHCVPGFIAVDGSALVYADPGCDGEPFHVTSGCTPSLGDWLAVFDWSTVDCGSEPTLHHLEPMEPHAGPIYRRSSDGACDPYEGPEPTYWYRLGEARAHDSFPALAIAIE